jgi:hypothetical protein
MVQIIADSVAGLLLIFMSFMIEGHNTRSVIILNVAPLVAGGVLCFLAFGRFMGWPIPN